MNNEIDNEYIQQALNELVNFFGVKEPVKCIDIFQKVRVGEIKEAVKLIAIQLGLPIDVNIINVPNEYRTQNSDNQFKSKSLVKAQPNSSVGITAQVSIPSNLPSYGSSALKDYPINVKISDNCTVNPLVFTMIMAHELSHILLYSLNHPEKENEFYTDLTAILFGFQIIFQDGRKYSETNVKKSYSRTTSIHTITYGYLNDDQFNSTFIRINEIIDKNRGRKEMLTDQLNRISKVISKYNKALFKFRYFFEYIAINPINKITNTDGKRMSELFQSGYIEDLDAVLNHYAAKKECIQFFLNEFTNYNKQGINSIENYIKELTSLYYNLENKLTTLKNDTKMLDKYIGNKSKINYFFQLIKN
jgi:hypothetical protein